MANTFVTGLTSSGSGPLGIGSQITFALTTDNAVTVTGTPALTLSNGASAVYAGMVDGHPTFTYTVKEGDAETPSLAVTGFDAANGTLNGTVGATKAVEEVDAATDLPAHDTGVVEVQADAEIELVDVISVVDVVSMQPDMKTGWHTGTILLPVSAELKEEVAVDLDSDNRMDVVDHVVTDDPSVVLERVIADAPFSAIGIELVTGAVTQRAVDATRPLAPILALRHDTGASAFDTVTNSAVLTVKGVEGDATLSYSIDGAARSATYNPLALSEGQHTVTVTQTDAAGNASVADSLSFTLDRTGPRVTSVVATGLGVVNGSGTLVTGQTVALSLAFSEELTLAGGTPSLKLSNGAVAVFDASASTATTLVFTYTVKADQVSSGLAVTAFRANGATIQDAAGNKAGIVLGNLNGTLVVDGHTGSGGADVFRSTGGVRTFEGLGGNDRYHVNHASDGVVEAAGGGTDWVLASVSYALKEGVEVERLTTNGVKLSAAIDLTGNEFAQRIEGNEAGNALRGMAGNDKLFGMGGGDTLDGGTGRDVLFGGKGADGFVFTAFGASNLDRVVDFSHEDGDRLHLDADVFKALTFTTEGELAASQFASISAGQRYEADDRIVYREDKGVLYYDADGYGGAVKAQAFAVLSGHPTLTAGDLFVM